MKKTITLLITLGLIFTLTMPLIANSDTSSHTNRTIDPQRPMVALTFDDGPDWPSVHILDILERYDSAATFFVLGVRVHGWAEVMERIHLSGSEAVGHSWDHPNLTEISTEEVAWQLSETHQAIEEVLGTSVPKIFRPPFSAQNAAVREVARDLGFSIIDWSLDPADWLVRDAEVIAYRVLSSIQDGDIVVMHDLGLWATAIAMETVIPELVARGYQLVTVSELFYHRGIDLQPGEVYESAPPRNDIGGHHSFVPLRQTAEALGYEVGWKAATQTVSIGSYITIILGEHTFMVDGVAHRAPVAPFIHDGYTLITTCTAYALFGEF